MDPLTLHAHAKVNLILSVGMPEPPGTAIQTPAGTKDVSGFHTIASWMAPIALADDIEITPLPNGPSHHEVRWSADAPKQTPIDWPIEKDLACRAHRALEAHVGRELPARIRVTKRIPVGGGLGGGSGDAAAVLVGLDRLFGLALGVERLQGVAMALGSDVAFFVDEELPCFPAAVAGFGEGVVRLPRVAADLILIVPTDSCPTGEVYRAFDVRFADMVASKRAEMGDRYKPPRAREETVAKRIEKAIAGGIKDDLLFNDLYIPAVTVRPKVGELARQLSKATRHHAHMTGSGSALFMVVHDDAERVLEKARAVAREADPGAAVLATRLV